MPAPLDSSLRRAAVRLLFLEGLPTRQVAETLGLAQSTVSKWKTQHKRRAGLRLKVAYGHIRLGEVDRGLRELKAASAMLGLPIEDDG
jgi:transposase